MNLNFFPVQKSQTWNINVVSPSPDAAWHAKCFQHFQFLLHVFSICRYFSLGFEFVCCFIYLFASCCFFFSWVKEFLRDFRLFSAFKMSVPLKLCQHIISGFFCRFVFSCTYYHWLCVTEIGLLMKTYVKFWSFGFTSAKNQNLPSQ